MCFVGLHGGLHLGIVPSIILSIGIAVVVGGLSFIPLRGLNPSARLNGLVITLAFLLIIESGLQLLTKARTLPVPLQLRTLPGGIHVLHALVIGSGLTLLFASFLFTRTLLYISMRAIADSETSAARFGINVVRVKTAGFLIGSCLVAIGGLLLAMRDGVATAQMGLLPGIRGFTAALLGTWSNIYGALLAALILTGIEQAFAYYVSAAYSDVVTFAALIAILALAPGGLQEVFARLLPMRGSNQC
jgi:branched-chain amino acid transport system permease protein